MAKSVGKQAATLKKERMEKLTLLVKTAIELGFTTKTAICEAAGIKLYELNDLFAYNKEIYGLYCIRRRTLVDTASDNLEEILKDKNHPQHFQATKYILEKYKSDLDDTLEGKESDKLGVSVSVGGNNTKRPVRITFTKDK
jgi:hypothetical protein